MATLLKGGGIITQTTGTSDLPAESAAEAVPETGKGTEADPGGGTVMATAGLGRSRVMNPQAAGDGSTARTRTQLLKRLVAGTELQGTNRMPESAWGEVSTVNRRNGIPPGNRGQGADDVRGGPAVLGDKHRGKSKGGGIAVRDNLQDLNRMSPTPQGGVSTISRHSGIPPGNPRQQGGNLINPGGHPTALKGRGKGSTPYREGYYCMSCYLCHKLYCLTPKLGLLTIPKIKSIPTIKLGA